PHTTFTLVSHHFLFHDPPTPEIYTLSLHDALPISDSAERRRESAIPCQTGARPWRLRNNLAAYQQCRTGVQRGRRVSLSASEERSEEHTSELQSRGHLVCRLLLEKKKKIVSEKNNQ